eukprot:CAMPEP_0197600232 /NCGR_PEP_ID=MMETSP1326-20131121/32885_1 /TAXON_ID=1155430 /ORGANISM="Genus nov. species nov., Strain RCC2288" /LENGTH=62 /DNA_ID=CAMNT_0043167309 /DNA_START=177 /DNA_END=362 /DNA_ORIENTATION=+
MTKKKPAMSMMPAKGRRKLDCSAASTDPPARPCTFLTYSCFSLRPAERRASAAGWKLLKLLL